MPMPYELKKAIEDVITLYWRDRHEGARGDLLMAMRKLEDTYEAVKERL